MSSNLNILVSLGINMSGPILLIEIQFGVVMMYSIIVCSLLVMVVYALALVL
jgi:hypothetical protein